MTLSYLWKPAIRYLGGGLGVVVIAACGVKKTEVVPIPPAYVDAKTASRSELVELLNDRYADIKSVTVSRLEVELTGGSVEEGRLEQYRDAKGILVAQRPDQVHLTILDPIISTTVLTMAAQRGRFQLWIPRRNQFVVGDTDVRPDEENPIYNVRPEHILKAILIDPLPESNPDREVLYYEEQDARLKYYVLEEIRVEQRAEVVRRLWVERSRLQLVRQQYYREGRLISDIVYDGSVAVDGKLVAARIELNRPEERYSLRFEMAADRVVIDREYPGERFQIRQPQNAEVIEVERKP